jgi:hypothetical protein
MKSKEVLFSGWHLAVAPAAWRLREASVKHLLVGNASPKMGGGGV